MSTFRPRSERTRAYPRRAALRARTGSSSRHGATSRRRVTEFRLFFPQELRYFLETGAFRFLRFYGDFDVERTSLDGTRLIAVAQKL